MTAFLAVVTCQTPYFRKKKKKATYLAQEMGSHFTIAVVAAPKRMTNESTAIWPTYVAQASKNRTK